MNLKRENKITLIYLAIGLGWILFSDYIVLKVANNPETVNTYQSYKGILYVLLTTILLYLLLSKTFRDLRRQRQELETSYQELQKYSRVEEKFKQELIISFTQILELHDPYTEGHSKKVAKLSKKIALKMKLPESEAKKVYWAGIVHDIGKILIPKSILNKKGNLNKSEYKKIKKHPFWGYRALSHSHRLREIAKIILHHHERWDGHGYPDGLKNNEIPILSCILCLADSWNAMRSKRPYRAPLSTPEALEEIKNNRGTQFNPEVVDAFMKL
ncbi:MAG: HD-GYP domain-containing protein [Halanaerobiaceae bacterium]